MGRRPLDLTNHPPFGRLTAVRPVGRKNASVLWLCRCSCGNTVEVETRYLRNGHTESCGCLRRDLTGERLRKKPKGRAQQYFELRAKGWSLRRIAARYGVRFQTVSNTTARAQRHPPRGDGYLPGPPAPEGTTAGPGRAPP